VQYDDAVRDTMKRRSLETYRDIARLHLLPAFGNKKLKDLTREHVQRMYSQKRDAGLSAARVRRIHGVLSTALNHAVRWRLIDHNVCKEVNPPRVPAPEIRPFSAEEAKRFLTAAQGDRYHALYVLGLTTDARIGELGGLFWSDLDLDRRVARIQRALITGRGGQTFESPKTPNSRRSIGLSQRAIDALEHHRECQKAKGLPVEGDSLVFTNTVGGPINPSHLLCRSFKPLLEKGGCAVANNQRRQGHDWEPLKAYFEYFKHFTTVATAVGLLIFALQEVLDMHPVAAGFALIFIGITLAMSVAGMLVMARKASGERAPQSPGRGTWMLAGTTALTFLASMVTYFLLYGG
jgi:integrase